MRVDLRMNKGNLKHLATVPRCLKTYRNGRDIKREHKCCCLYCKAVAITYSRVNEQHLEVPFVLFLSYYFSYGAGILKHT